MDDNLYNSILKDIKNLKLNIYPSFDMNRRIIGYEISGSSWDYGYKITLDDTETLAKVECYSDVGVDEVYINKKDSEFTNFVKTLSMKAVGL